MAKKFSLLLAAAAVVAFAAMPAFASATTLTIGGVAAKKDAAIKGVSTNAVTITPLGELKCNEVVVNGKVTVNEGGTVEGNGSPTEATASTCFIEPQHEEIKVENITLTRLHSEGSAGTGTATFSFTALLPGELDCVYSGTVPGSFTNGSNKIHLEGTGLNGSPGICGESPEVFFSADFTLSSPGGAVALDF